MSSVTDSGLRQTWHKQQQRVTSRRRQEVHKAAIPAIVFAAAAPLFFLVKVPLAQAATTCYAGGCNGQLAANTTCAADSYVAEQANIIQPGGTTVIGNIQLKYSPSCRTTWARVIGNEGYTTDPPWAEAISSSSSIDDPTCTGSGAPGTGCNTTMIDDLGLTSVARGGAAGIIPAGQTSPPFNSATTSPPF
jgi:hypothetical protein